jgi:hypothetical protein
MEFFERPDDYSKMLNRMAIITGIIVFVSSAFAIQVLSEKGIVLPSPKALTNQEISFFGFKAYFWALVPAIVISWIFRRVQVHDRISDSFRIREAFDTHVILVRLAGEVGIPIDLTAIKKLRRDRQDLMYKVFYHYVDAHEPRISRHQVSKSLDAWFGYWIAIEAAAVLIPFGLFFLVLGASATSAVFITLALVCVFIGMRYFGTCAPLAEHEIAAMTNHDDWRTWKDNIKKHFDNALCS